MAQKVIKVVWFHVFFILFAKLCVRTQIFLSLFEGKLKNFMFFHEILSSLRNVGLQPDVAYLCFCCTVFYLCGNFPVIILLIIK